MIKESEIIDSVAEQVPDELDEAIDDIGLD